MNTKSRTWLRIAAILAVTLIALGLRLRAADLLPIDYDEDDYLRAGLQFADHPGRRLGGVDPT